MGPASHVFAGYADGTLKKWEIQSGNSVLHIEKHIKKQLGTQKCLIWKLRIFQNFLISGDSQGEVCIWDSKFGTLVKSFNHLKADILALEVNHKLQTIYATGVDSRVVSISLLEDIETSNKDWVLSSIYRGQSHDIKSLIMLDNDTLLSGGVTTDICIYKLQEGRFKDQFGKNSLQQNLQEKVRHVPPFPFQSVAALDSSIVVLQSGNGHSLEIYSTNSHK